MNDTSYQREYSNSWALVIGINKYQNISPLSSATNDANAVAKILEEKYKFPRDNITLLLDDNATNSAIRKAFLNYANKANIKTDDRLLVFFAGHGHTITGKRGEVGHLVPVDGKIDDLDTLIRWDELTRNADLVPAKHIFFLMDACYGGLALLRSPAFGSYRFLGDMLQRYSRQVLTAGKADEPVSDGNGIRPGHSIFTAHLLNALDGSASTKEGIITANGVMAYVYDKVGNDQYSHQTPHYGFIDGDGDFVFDTTLLEELKSSEETNPERRGKKGEDILINTSPQVSNAPTIEDPIADRMKDLLSDPSKKIKLDDFISSQVRRFLEAIDLRHFPVQTPNIKPADFVSRVSEYEEATRDLQQVVTLLAKWGDDDQLKLLEKIFLRVAEADKGSAGTVLWLKLTWYPIMVLMYSAGIAALANKNFKALKVVLETPVEGDGEYSGKKVPVIMPVGSEITGIIGSFKWLPGHEKQYVPRSEHLFKTLQPILEDLLFVGRSYEALFDTFEVLFALAYSYATGLGWGPPGRFGWKHKSPLSRENSPYIQVIEEARKERENWGPIKAGLFNSSLNDFLGQADTYKQELDKLSWW